MALNKVFLIGNAGKDPDIRHTDSGTTVATFTLATSERYKDRNGEVHEQTEWHNIVAWRGLADVVGNYVKKGTQVYIEGKIRSRSWDDQDGQKRYTTEIFADNIILLGKREGSGKPLPQEPGEPVRPHESITEAAARVAASQQKNRQGQQHPQQQPTTPLIPPEQLSDEGVDDLPF